MKRIYLVWYINEDTWNHPELLATFDSKELADNFIDHHVLRPYLSIYPTWPNSTLPRWNPRTGFGHAR